MATIMVMVMATMVMAMLKDSLQNYKDDITDAVF